MCVMITNKHLPAKYLSFLLTKWLLCVERIPSEPKFHIFRGIKPDLRWAPKIPLFCLIKWEKVCSFFFDRANCGRFLVEASCHSMQMQMMDIICSYLDGKTLKSDDLAKKLSLFLKVFKGTIKDIKNTELIKTAVNIFGATNKVSTFNEKHRMLNLLNGFTENRSIYSMPIESLKSKSDGTTTQEVTAKFVKNCISSLNSHSINLWFFSTNQDGCIWTPYLAQLKFRCQQTTTWKRSTSSRINYGKLKSLSEWTLYILVYRWFNLILCVFSPVGSPNSHRLWSILYFILSRIKKQRRRTRLSQANSLRLLWLLDVSKVNWLHGLAKW